MFSYGNSLLWTWNLGFTCGLALLSQIFTGVVLAMRYETDFAHVRIERVERYSGGWAWRRAHSTVSTIYFIAMYLHVCRSIWSNSSSMLSWGSGGVLYFLSLIVALMGYSLTNGNMAQWALTVVSSIFVSFPYGEIIYKIIIGDYGISYKILPRIYTIHFLIGIIIPIGVLWHTSAVHKDESSTDLITRNNISGKEFISSGMIKDSIIILLIISGIIQGFKDSSYLWGLIEDENANDWPQINRTPEPIGPEWYVLPWFSLLKLTSLNWIMIAFVTLLWSIGETRSGKRNFIFIGFSGMILGLLALVAHESLEEPLFFAYLAIWSGLILTTNKVN